VSPEDRDRARALLVERLRQGAMGYDEYERRLLKAERARWVPELYDATFGRARLAFGGSRWRRRRLRITLGGVLVAAASAGLSLLWSPLAAVGILAAALVVVVNVAVAVQRRRYPPLPTGQNVGGASR
jgi:Flp pilus assembly protein TadB